MAKLTTNYNLGAAAWVQIAGAGQTVYVQMLPATSQAFYAYGSSAPAASSPGHVIDPSETLIDTNIPTPMWMRGVGGGTADVAVSVGGTSGASTGTRTTTSVQLTGTWQQICATGDSVHLDHIDGATIRWAYSASAPTSTSQGHVLRTGEEYYDLATDQNIWARSDVTVNTAAAMSTIVVTKG